MTFPKFNLNSQSQTVQESDVSGLSSSSTDVVLGSFLFPEYICMCVNV